MSYVLFSHMTTSVFKCYENAVILVYIFCKYRYTRKSVNLIFGAEFKCSIKFKIILTKNTIRKTARSFV